MLTLSNLFTVGIVLVLVVFCHRTGLLAQFLYPIIREVVVALATPPKPKQPTIFDHWQAQTAATNPDTAALAAQNAELLARLNRLEAATGATPAVAAVAPLVAPAQAPAAPPAAPVPPPPTPAAPAFTFPPPK